MTFLKLAYQLIQKQISVLKVSQFFLGLFIIFFPFQIRTLIYSGSEYLTGNFNPYTTFFLYLGDLFLVISFLSWGISRWRNRESSAPIDYGDHIFTFLLLLFLATLCLSVFQGEKKILNLFISLRFLELFLFYLLIINRILSIKKIVFLFLTTMAFQALMAVFQYTIQSSIGLKILGEPFMNIQTLGAAKIDLLGSKILRAFGTFPHANILGGALTIGILFSFVIKDARSAYLYRERSELHNAYSWIRYSLIALLSIGLLLTFSRSALFGIVAAFLVYISVSEKKIPIRAILLTLSLLLFFTVAFRLENILFQRFLFEDIQSTQERTLYLGISKDMILSKPLGIGLGEFTLQMQNFTNQKLMPWIFQPVHNVFFLITNEGGVVAGVLFIFLLGYLFYRLVQITGKKGDPTAKKEGIILLALLSGIITIAVFDHYFFTIYAGQIMLFLYWGVVSEFLKRSRLPAKNTSIGNALFPSS